VLGLAVLGAAALAYLAAPGARLDAWALGRVRAGVAAALGRPVSVASVRVSVLTRRIEVRDLVVGAMPPSTRAVLTIPAVTLLVSPWPLFQGRLELSSVRVARPVVGFWREDGRWEGPFPAATGEQGTLEIALRRLDVLDGVVSFEDRSFPLWCRAEEVRLAWTSGPGGDGRVLFVAAAAAHHLDSGPPSGEDKSSMRLKSKESGT